MLLVGSHVNCVAKQQRQAAWGQAPPECLSSPPDSHVPFRLSPSTPLCVTPGVQSCFWWQRCQRRQVVRRQRQLCGRRLGSASSARASAPGATSASSLFPDPLPPVRPVPLVYTCSRPTVAVDEVGRATGSGGHGIFCGKPMNDFYQSFNAVASSVRLHWHLSTDEQGGRGWAGM